TSARSTGINPGKKSPKVSNLSVKTDGLTALIRTGGIAMAAALTNASTAPLTVAAATRETTGSRDGMRLLKVKEPFGERCSRPVRTRLICAKAFCCHADSKSEELNS